MSRKRGTKGGHVSASQIETFLLCARKWAYQYIDGIKSKPNKNAELGIEVHDVFKDWFKHGKAPDLGTRAGQIVKAGLRQYHHVPPPGSPELAVEEELRFTFDTVEYLGYADLQWWTRPRFALSIIDHKTSTDPVKWGKTEAHLETDVQRVFYAFHGVYSLDAHEVRAQWIYHRSCPPYRSFDPVESLEQRNTIIDRFGDIVHPVAQKLVKLRKKQSHELEQNFAACSAFGGCAFQERCHGGLSPMDRLKSAYKQFERSEKAAEQRQGAPPVERVLAERKGKEHMRLLDKLKKGEGSLAKAAAPEEPELPKVVLGETLPPPTPEEQKALDEQHTNGRKRNERKPKDTLVAPADAPALPAVAVEVPPAAARLIFFVAALVTGRSPDDAQAFYAAYRGAP